jgi:hypothetical protein
MHGLNFDPFVGQQVLARGYRGVYKIVSVRSPNLTAVPEGWKPNDMGAEGGRTVDLRGVASDSFVQSVPWAWLDYVDETGPVWHAIEWLKENPVVPFPDCVLDYQVEARDDHQGNPSLYVRFFVEPDDQPSAEKIKELNRFLDSVSTLLLSLGLDRWPYVQVSEKQSLLNVAS